ncbi:unnamed protein product, partial [Nesidiocoris tenuis]
MWRASRPGVSFIAGRGGLEFGTWRGSRPDVSLMKGRGGQSFWAGKPPVGTHLDVMKEDKLVQNLTEFNTAHNRRISMLGIGDDAETAQPRSKKKRKCITFSEEHELINPEDVDPSVGRFRNMVHTTVIPGKRQRYDPNLAPTPPPVKDLSAVRAVHPTVNLYSDLPHPHGEDRGSNPILSSMLASRLGIALPDPAPEVDIADPNAGPEMQRLKSELPTADRAQDDQPSKKKIYAKEAWPGKKPLAPLLLVSAPPTNFLKAFSPNSSSDAKLVVTFERLRKFFYSLPIKGEPFLPSALAEFVRFAKYSS